MKARIALVGVPGSGKTRLAQAIKRSLPEYKFAICDGYVEKLQERMQMSIGIEATYLPNVHIASTREQEIRKLVLEDRNFIVCGSVFDTLCYEGFHAEIISNTAGDQEQKAGLLMREMTAAQLFAYLAVDSFSTFTHVFYLPVTDPDLLVAISSIHDKNELPGENEALDKTLQDALRRYGNPATLLRDKHSKNVQTVVEAIKAGNSGTDGQSDSIAGE